MGVLLCTVIVSNAQGWRGIVPLYSTRADVEALIGPPIQPNGITYNLKNERVNIVYSTASCEKRDVEWNVPPGTVISITVYPQTKLLISEAGVDLRGFVRIFNPQNPGSVSYTKNDEGIGITTKANGQVIAIEYFPATKDNSLRCPGFSRDSLTNDQIQYFKFDEFSKLTLDDEKLRLDNFASRLRREPNTRGYIRVFSTQADPSDEAQARARRVTEYLVNVRDIEPTRIIVIKGAGPRNCITVELFVVPNSGSRATH